MSEDSLKGMAKSRNGGSPVVRAKFVPAWRELDLSPWGIELQQIHKRFRARDDEAFVDLLEVVRANAPPELLAVFDAKLPSEPFQKLRRDARHANAPAVETLTNGECQALGLKMLMQSAPDKKDGLYMIGRKNVPGGPLTRAGRKLMDRWLWRIGPDIWIYNVNNLMLLDQELEMRKRGLAKSHIKARDARGRAVKKKAPPKRG